VELNWTTLILEIVNFLVLVWILKHFLYRPVLRVIEERRAGIEAALDEAKQRQDEAEKLRSQYENRLAEWQQDRQQAREALQREIQQQRSRALEEQKQSLDAEREKARVIEQRRARELEEGRERAALALGARFASRLLEGLSGPELEGRILEMVCEALGHLPEERQAALRRALANGGSTVRVESAHALDDGQRQRLVQALQGLLGSGVHCTFEERPELISGLRLSVGDWSLGLNLRDELEGFADQAHALR
jgi:F-type H+-transporting ATPase subunit b